MLKLTRREQESISLFIYDMEIKVLVVQIKGNQVGLCFEAPQEVEILREELIERWSD
ncbi:carbon storage regulator [Paraferrimonas sedimenticola]|uniref:Carbon storage regulator, CsrA n=1 Tax=Paraferrimonas sedimenticola TaxID=375674 RepID=A0AA37VZY8_9GAMM|nr:carbon storage regulator [Paraferrimonas sedimenticola]GLP94707.1 hypothetical protein GCM10007895_00130 [Paraferrimonas sedimenticola]